MTIILSYIRNLSSTPPKKLQSGVQVGYQWGKNSAPPLGTKSWEWGTAVGELDKT